MKWGDPTLLWLLAVMVPLLLILRWSAVRHRKNLQRLAEDKALAHLLVGYDAKARNRRRVCWFLGIGFILLALARPQYGFTWEVVKRRGLDVMVVLDTSNSMLAEDIKPNRLERAKLGLRDLVSQLNGDRIGLVAFAGSSFLQCPLTIDYAAFLMTLDDVYAGIIPRGGTDIQQALYTALESFNEQSGSDKAIILITDGEMHGKTDQKMMARLKDEDIRVFALGVGTPDGELIPVKDEHGTVSFLKDSKGHVVKSSLNEALLENLALETEGIYLRSLAGDFGLERIVQQGLAPLQRSELDSRLLKHYEERFPIPLAIGLALLGLEAAMGGASRKKREAQ